MTKNQAEKATKTGRILQKKQKIKIYFRMALPFDLSSDFKPHFRAIFELSKLTKIKMPTCHLKIKNRFSVGG